MPRTGVPYGSISYKLVILDHVQHTQRGRCNQWLTREQHRDTNEQVAWEAAIIDAERAQDDPLVPTAAGPPTV
jgi:hypothetical protein